MWSPINGVQWLKVGHDWAMIIFAPPHNRIIWVFIYAAGDEKNQTTLHLKQFCLCIQAGQLQLSNKYQKKLL